MNYSFLNKSILALFIMHAGCAFATTDVPAQTVPVVQSTSITKAIAAMPKAVWTKISNNPKKSIILTLILTGAFVVWYNLSQEETDEEVKCLY